MNDYWAVVARPPPITSRIFPFASPWLCPGQESRRGKGARPSSVAGATGQGLAPDVALLPFQDGGGGGGGGVAAAAAAAAGPRAGARREGESGSRKVGQSGSQYRSLSEREGALWEWGGPRGSWVVLQVGGGGTWGQVSEGDVLKPRRLVQDKRAREMLPSEKAWRDPALLLRGGGGVSRCKASVWEGAERVKPESAWPSLPSAPGRGLLPDLGSLRSWRMR